MWGHEGPPMVPPPYNDIYQIFQTPGYVVLFPELANNPARIIPTNGQAHLPERVRQWSGDSIGRWHGDTLVVDTTNFVARPALRPASENLHVVERFRRIDENNLHYSFTVEAPTIWTEPSVTRLHCRTAPDIWWSSADGTRQEMRLKLSQWQMSVSTWRPLSIQFLFR